MNWQQLPFILLKIVAAILSLVLARWVWRRRATPGATPTAIYMVAAACWAFASAMETSNASLAAQVLWSKILYVGPTIIPVAWLAVALEYTGRQAILTRRNLTLLMVVPLITLVAVWTNEAHQLIWQNLALSADGAFPKMVFSRGPLYWVNVVYAYSLTLIAIVLMLRAFLRTSRAYRLQTGALVIAALLPWAGNIMYMTGLTPWPGVDLTSVFFAFTGFIMLLALFRFKLLDIVPVARDAIVASMSDAVMVFDAENRLVDLNQAAEALLGRATAALIGQPAAQVFANWAELFEEYQDIEEAHTELMLGDDEGERDFDLRISPLRDRHGLLTGRVLSLRDITERKQSEAALQSAHDQLAVLVTVDAELVLRLDVDHVLEIAMDAAMRVGRADAGFIGLMDREDLRVVQVLGDYPPNFKNTLVPAQAGTIMQAVREQQAILKTDVEHYAQQVTVLPSTRAQMVAPLLSHERLIGIINLETRKPERFTPEVFELLKLLAARVATAIDNAQLYESRIALIEDLDAFAHTVAHDLKNPLNTCILSGSLLERSIDVMPEATRQRSVQAILNGAHKMNDIIDALLLLAGVRQMEAVDTRQLDMQGIVGEVLARLDSMIREAQAEIILPDTWPVALGYAPWIEEVFANYLSNALKYGGQPPVVTLGSDCLLDGKVRFWVRDNGAGLTADERARLFTPFTRLHQVEAEGHGLGLSIVRRIVEKLGGEVGIESEVGQGSLFSFTLPGVLEVEQ